MTRTAFVFGGGGLLGATETGMARALVESGVVPDLILGTSIGAINGAVLATDPSPVTAQHLVEMWDRLSADGLLGGSVTRITQFLRTRTSLHSHEPLRALLSEFLPDRFEDLTTDFQCVAANIEHARETWFGTGPLVEAVLASASLPGVFPALEIDGEHYLDGGLVNSIPIARAVALGADVVWVLHVGRIEETLTAPRYPWEVGFVAFEVARRHRFHYDIAQVPKGVTVRVLPAGIDRRSSSWSNLRYRDTRRIADRAAVAYAATLAYLEEMQAPR